MAVYVLVHGGGHGGWCYKPVAKLLRMKGYEVHTPSLTGCADRQHILNPHIDLDTHIMDIVNLLIFEDLTEVILVGHSYGGMVVTGVVDRAADRVGHLVYLDAAIPENGEALLDVSPGLRAFQEANKVVDGVELGLFPGEATVSLYGIHDSGLSAWVAPRLTPHPWKCFEQKLYFTNPADVAGKPRTIINCTSTLAVRDTATMHRWTTGERVWEIDTGHDLMLLEPERVAEMLLRLAQ